MFFTQIITTAFFSIFLLLSPSLSEDTVMVDLGLHQLQRLVDLLTVHECEELLMTLSNPVENISNQLHSLSEETNQFRMIGRSPRDTDKKSHCHSVLIDWLQTNGEQMYYDRLSRTLQQIGRTDIAIELGKNINQDKTLAMQRYVDEYHEHINQIPSYLMHSQAEETHHSVKKVIAITTMKSPKSQALTKVTIKYQDIEDGFSKDKDSGLPLHRPTNCDTELLPGTIPPNNLSTSNGGFHLRAIKTRVHLLFLFYCICRILDCGYSFTQPVCHGRILFSQDIQQICSK